MHRYLVIFLSVLSLAAVFFLWRYFSAPSVETAGVTKGPAVEAVYATATVEPVNWAAVAPVKTGRVVEILAEEGDTVEKNQVLARLEDDDLQAQMEEAKTSAVYYAGEVSRAEDLIRSGAVSKENLDSRRMELDRYQARVKMFEEQIRQLSLRAPEDGTVLWRDVERGEVKEAGKALFWVGQPRPLRLEAEVDEEDIPKVKPGQDVLISADAFSGKVMTGRIDRISPKGDTVNKSYRVYMALPDDTPLMIGMTVETNTVVQKKEDALLVPVEALTDGPAVWLAVPGATGTIARKTPVERGIDGEEQTEILSGVKAEDRVILPPFDKLRDGGDVRVK